MVNRTIFSAASCTEGLGDEVLDRIVRSMFNELNEMLLLENLALAVYDEETTHLKTACFVTEENEEELHVPTAGKKTVCWLKWYVTIWLLFCIMPLYR